MWLRMLLAGGLLAGLLSACAVIDPVDNRYDTVSRSLAKARNESIFLNLVRASHDYPLSFVVIANVTPSMTNTSSLALPSFLLGPRFNNALPTTLDRDVVFGNTTASNSTAVSTNFNVSTQETSTFYEGFLKPIDLQTLNYFIRQGYPREMLFWLFTDSFEFTKLDTNETLGYHYDPTADYGCNAEDPKHRCFIDWVRIATLTGLTVEEESEQSASSGGGSSSGGSKPGGSGPGGGSKPTTTAFAQFCFSQVLAQQAKTTMPKSVQASLAGKLDVPVTTLYGPTSRCMDNWTPPDATKPQPDVLPIKVGTSYSFRIIPRSAYGVFEFLGKLMRIERDHLGPAPGAYIPAGRQDVTQLPILSTVSDDQNLISVTHNLGGECFVHTWFNDGDYCVPEQAATTKRIFGLLAQLIAIQTAATDLSITPIVRVLQ